MLQTTGACARQQCLQLTSCLHVAGRGTANKESHRCGREDNRAVAENQPTSQAQQPTAASTEPRRLLATSEAVYKPFRANGGKSRGRHFSGLRRYVQRAGERKCAALVLWSLLALRALHELTPALRPSSRRRQGLHVLSGCDNCLLRGSSRSMQPGNQPTSGEPVRGRRARSPSADVYL